MFVLIYLCRCPYEVLDLPVNASARQVKQTYLLLAQKMHPDVAPNPRDATDKFAEIK